MAIALQFNPIDFSLSVTYVKDAHFQQFEYRIYEDDADEEEAEIIPAQGLDIGGDVATIFVNRGALGNIGSTWKCEVRVKNVNGKISTWAADTVIATPNSTSVPEAEGATPLTDYVLIDGTREMTDDWDIGPHELRAETVHVDVTTGTAPFIVASTTLVDNLNADLLDGSEEAVFSYIDGTRNFTGVVAGIDPTASNHLATKEYVDQTVSFIQDFFYNDDASDIGGIYYDMEEQPTGEGESTFVTAGLAAGDGQALTNWATIANVPGVTIFKGGVYVGHVHAAKTAGTKPVTIYFELYTRTSGGAETLRATSEDSGLISALNVGYELHATVDDDVTINATDRIVIKWYANVGVAGSNATVTLYAEGTNSSSLSVPTTTEILSTVFLRQDGTTPLTDEWDAGGNFAILIDTINESDADAGVTIESVLLKDDNITAGGTVQAEHFYSTDDAVIDDLLTVGGNAIISERLQVTGNTAPTTDAGIEIGWDGTDGIILAFDRDTTSYKNMKFNALSYEWWISNTQELNLDNTHLYPESGSGLTLGKSTNRFLNVHSVSVTASGTVQAEHLYSTDDAVIDDDLSVGGNLTVAEYIYHAADLDTYLRFETDTITLLAGNAVRLFLNDDGTSHLKLPSSQSFEIHDSSDVALLAVVEDGNTTLSPAGDLILDPVGNDVLPGTGYDIDLGSLQKKYLTLHAAELWVETLVAQDTIATIGGRILVGPTTALTEDFGSGETTITVKHNQMASGDRIYMEADGKVEFMSVDSAAGGGGPYTYTVTRNLDGSGANDWYAGDAVFNTGAAGDGFIDLYSYSGVTSGTTGPTIVGNVRNSATYNDWSEHWAIGNLDGLYGYGSTTYGVGLGEYSATTAFITIDSTNGYQVHADNRVVAQWKVDGDIVFFDDGETERILIGTISSTATEYGLKVHDNSAGDQSSIWVRRIAPSQGGGSSFYWNCDGTDPGVDDDFDVQAFTINADAMVTASHYFYGIKISADAAGIGGVIKGIDIDAGDYIEDARIGIDRYGIDARAEGNTTGAVYGVYGSARNNHADGEMYGGYFTINLAPSDATTGAGLYAAGNLALSLPAIEAFGDVDITGDIAVSGDAAITGVITLAEWNGDVIDSAYIDQSLFVASITVSGTVQAEHLYSTDDLVVDGLATIGETLTIDGDILANDGAEKIGSAGTPFDLIYVDEVDLGTNVITDGNLTGSWTGVVNLTASGTVQAEHLYSTDDAVIDDLLTVGRIGIGEAAPPNANMLLSVLEHKLAGFGTTNTSLGYAGGISAFGSGNESGDGSYFGWIGQNVRWDGADFYRATDQSSANWGNIAGIRFQRGSQPGDDVIQFITDGPNEAGAGEQTIGASLNSMIQAYITNNGDFVSNHNITAVGTVQAEHLYSTDDIAADGDLGFKSDTAFLGEFQHAITAARAWTMPDKSGTVALLDDVDPDVWIPLGPFAPAGTVPTAGTGQAASIIYVTDNFDILEVADATTGVLYKARVRYVHDDSHTTLRLSFAAWKDGVTLKTDYTVYFYVDGVSKGDKTITVTSETNDEIEWTIAGLTQGNGYELQMVIVGITEDIWAGGVEPDEVNFRHNPKKTMFFANAA